MLKKFRLIAALLIWTTTANFMSNAYALGCTVPEGNFSLSVQVNSTCQGTLSTNNAPTFIDSLQSLELSSITQGLYTGSEASVISVNFNYLPLTIQFPVANSSQLNLIIPALGINKTFVGATRDDSATLLENYLKNTDVIGKIMKYQAANSPISPIAGAGGLLPSVVANDFLSNFTSVATDITSPTTQVSTDMQNKPASTNLVGVAVSYGSLTSLDNKISVISIPLSYTVRNDFDPRRQLIFSLPISQIDTNGAKSYTGSAGVAYRFPINNNWTLTPAGRLSAVSSMDMATAAGLYSGSLTSVYVWNMEGYNVSMGNTVTYAKSMKIKTGDFSFDPGITNTVYRNGVMLSQPINWGGKLSVEYSFADTRYTGTNLYIKDTQEVGVTIGTSRTASSPRNYLRAGLTYMRGQDTHGLTANLGYWF